MKYKINFIFDWRKKLKRKINLTKDPKKKNNSKNKDQIKKKLNGLKLELKNEIEKKNQNFT